MSNKHTARHIATFEPVYELISLTNADSEINGRIYRQAVCRIIFNKKRIPRRGILPEFTASAAFLFE